MGNVSVIVEGQRPDGTYAAPKLNSSNELVVAGSVGGGSGAVQISDGTNTATITNVAGKKSLDVNVTDITLTHQSDSITLGDGTNAIGSTNDTLARGLNTHITNDKVLTESIAYKSLVDEASSTVTYVGKALTGASTGSAAWQISRISISGSLTSVEYAGGTTSFNQIWANRAGLTYS